MSNSGFIDFQFGNVFMAPYIIFITSIWAMNEHGEKMIKVFVVNEGKSIPISNSLFVIDKSIISMN